MTENEIKNAIKTINTQLENALQKEKETEGTHDTVIWHLVANDYRCASKALEEIQEYQAIGTVEQIERGLRFIDGDDNSGIVEDLRELHKYYLIGTVEECREAMERQMGKKVAISHVGNAGDRGIAFCPNCGMDIHGRGMIGYCFRCGQAILWEIDTI